MLPTKGLRNGLWVGLRATPKVKLKPSEICSKIISLWRLCKNAQVSTGKPTISMQRVDFSVIYVVEFYQKFYQIALLSSIYLGFPRCYQLASFYYKSDGCGPFER